MKTLLKSVRIIDEKSDFNGQVKDVLIDAGKISRIADTIEDKADKPILFPLAQVGIAVSMIAISVFPYALIQNKLNKYNF